MYIHTYVADLLYYDENYTCTLNGTYYVDVPEIYWISARVNNSLLISLIFNTYQYQIWNVATNLILIVANLIIALGGHN